MVGLQRHVVLRSQTPPLFDLGVVCYTAHIEAVQGSKVRIGKPCWIMESRRIINVIFLSIVGSWTLISATRIYRSKDIARSHSTLSKLRLQNGYR